MRYTVTMPSPFPGMDPYLEGALWPDVHHSLGVAIRNQLAGTIDRRYSIRLETSVVSDESGSEPVAIMFPDVHLHHPVELESTERVSSVATLSPPMIVPAPTLARITSIRVRLAGERTLVTSIEILSPANKYGNSFQKFYQKWDNMRRAGVNLVEIDFIRRGRRIFSQPSLRDAPYLVTVTPGSRANTGAWPISLRESLPEIPIPLLASDGEARLNLQELFAIVYEQGRYANDIDYARDSPPPPALSVEDAAWVRSLSSPAER